MHNHKTRMVLILLSVFLCLIVALKVTAGSDDAAEIEVPDTKTSNSIPDPTVKASMIYSPPLATEEIAEPVEEVWPYPISQEEIDLIALVTMAEAEGETEFGKRLVIDTILNRVDDSHFPDTVHDVIYYPNAFSPMWNGRIDRCYIMEDIVELVKEELLERTNYECVFFTAGRYSVYGVPMFQECCHYFSSYD